MTITSNCQLINQKLNQLRNLLVEKLSNCYIEKETTNSFTELIESVGDIKAIETINQNNTKPSSMPKIDNTDISTFNITLYARIRYYMKLLGHFLVLKGVPRSKVNEQTDLKGLIELIDMIDVIKPSFLTIEPINETQYFGTNIEVPYTLIDDDGMPIEDGDITIKDSSGIVYDSIEAGNPILITPLNISSVTGGEYQYQTFIIKYNGGNKHSESEPKTLNVKILPAKIRLIVDVTNATPTSRYFNSAEVGYTGDEWTISVSTFDYNNQPLSDIPFDLTIDEDIILDDEQTDENGSYVFNQVIDEAGNHIINCSTNYLDTTKMTNVLIDHEINIKYGILSQSTQEYTDYTGKDSYRYEIEVINEESGQKTNKHDGKEVKILLGNDYNSSEQIGTSNIIDGKVVYTFDSLNTGDKVLTWVFQYDNFDYKTTTKLHILSNFILPVEQNYFLNDTPAIIYAPEGVKKTNNTVALDINKDGFLSTITLTTDDNGRLNGISNYKTVGHYELTLRSGNNLNEERLFDYDIEKPFDIELLNYDKKTRAQYKITLYDEKDPYFLTIKNNNNVIDENLYNVSTTTSFVDGDGNKYEYSHKTLIVDIPISDEMFGENQLSFTINEYTESVNFNFINKVFSLLTSSVMLGNDEIQIRCNDSTINSIDIESSDININNITYENNIFTINATFLKAGNISFDTIDTQLYRENFTIYVNKYNINDYIGASISVSDPQSSDTNGGNVNIIDANRILALFDINTVLYSDLSIDYVLKKGDRQLWSNSFIYGRNDENKNFTINIPNARPGQYQLEFSLHNDNNYNDFLKTVDFKITGNLFVLLTSSVELGNDEMQIKCNDSTVNSITIESPNIKINNITYENGIFIVDSTFLKAGNISFNIIDSQSYHEDSIVQVNKGEISNYVNALISVSNPQSSDTINNNIDIIDTNNISASFNINTILYSDLSISYSLKKNGNQLWDNSFSYHSKSAQTFAITIPNVRPGQYQLEFSLHNDDNYIDFVKIIDFEIVGEFFELLTSSIEVGYGNIQIKCNGTPMPSITVDETPDIKVSHISQNENIFKIYGDFLKAGNISFSIVDDQLYRKSFSINVEKATVSSSFFAHFKITDPQSPATNLNKKRIAVIDIDRTLIRMFVIGVDLYYDLPISVRLSMGDTIWTKSFDYDGGEELLPLEISDPKVGSYVIAYIDFDGDDNYKPVHEKISFIIVDKIFTLSTPSATLGRGEMRIECNVSTIKSISIESSDIQISNITYENSIFVVDGIFTKTGNISFDVISNETYRESLSIQVNKADISGNISASISVANPQSVDTSGNTIGLIDSDSISLLFSTNTTLYSNLSIDYVLARGSNQLWGKSFTYLSNDESKSIAINIPNLRPGQYQLTLTLQNNDSYQNFNKTINFEVVGNFFNIETLSVTLGNDTMKIGCYNNTANSISIESSNISTNNISYASNIFTVDAVFSMAGDISFDIIDDQLYRETLSIRVGKADISNYINASIFVENPQSSSTSGANISLLDTDSISVSFDVDTVLYSDLSINCSITQENNEIWNQLFTYSRSQSGAKIIPVNLSNATPGEYQLDFNFTGNNNYNTFNKTINFKILTNISTHEITQKYTNFKINLPYFYRPSFTESAPEELISGTNTILSSTQSNGIWESVGYYLKNGWSNIGLWECDFDVKGGILYIGLYIAAIQSSSIEHLFGSYEGGLATNPPGSYTRNNDNRLNFVNKSRNPWSGGDYRYFDWCHINIKKSSPTKLTITKTGGKYNDGSVTYEWQELPNYSKLTIGTKGNEDGIREIRDKIMIKNFTVRGEQ